MAWDRDGQLKPNGPKAWRRTGDALFARTCPFSPDAANEDELAAALYPEAPDADPLIGRFQSNYVGHVAEGDFRARGSSGGLITWVAAELLRRGLVDAIAHVAPVERSEPEDRLFAYRLSRTVDELQTGAKSRYYPIELAEVLATIRATPGRYAVVGIPCFIKAVNLLRREDPVIAERIAFTIGLFCGHMKSARMVDSFAWQMGARPEQVEAIDYRLKNPDRPANWYTAHLTLPGGETRQQDWWHLVDGDWGSGFFMNSACNFCDDVVAETADIALGDAWLEPYSSDGRGTNVVIVRSVAMHGLVEEGIAQGRLSLSAVDHDFVRRTQAAGFRQRREGLSFRLARARKPVQPRKRVAPSLDIPARRKLIYRMRGAITAWSPRMFRLARATRRPKLFIAWGKAALGLYHAAAYSRGRMGKLVDRWIDPVGDG